MSRDRTCVELLRERLEMERRVAGLEYMRVTVAPNTDTSKSLEQFNEQVAEEILKIEEAVRQGRFKPFKDY